MIVPIWKIGKTNDLNGTWDWTRTSIALRVKETYNLSTHPGNTFRMVRVTGLEPARSFEPGLLRTGSLPISSHPHYNFQLYI